MQPEPQTPLALPDPNAPEMDATNPKIITAAQERRLLEICKEILPAEDLQGKDTESDHSVLYRGKSNRWIVRFWSERKRPSIQSGIPLTDARKAEIRRARMEPGANETALLGKPENLQRLAGPLAGLLTDALIFCINDENLKRKTETA